MTTAVTEKQVVTVDPTIRIEKVNSKLGRYRLQADMFVDLPIEKVFEFFSDASNLERITPPFLQFIVLTEPPIDMFNGQTIDYKLKMRGIPIRWQSEITDWNPPHKFVDQQRRGPYKVWHHTHTFEECNGGTIVGDIVHYDFFGGDIIHNMFIKRDLKNIFGYRHTSLEKIFSEMKQN